MSYSPCRAKLQGDGLHHVADLAACRSAHSLALGILQLQRTHALHMPCVSTDHFPRVVQRHIIPNAEQYLFMQHALRQAVAV